MIIKIGEIVSTWVDLQLDGLLVRIFFSQRKMTSIAQVATQIKYCLIMREKIHCADRKNISGSDYALKWLINQ